MMPDCLENRIVPCERTQLMTARGLVNALARVLAGITESRTLATLGDALLPKLMAGELRVRDAARHLNGVP
jgi:hypothetical protein